MGSGTGVGVGAAVAVGATVGAAVGAAVGTALGASVGVAIGAAVAANVGVTSANAVAGREVELSEVLLFLLERDDEELLARSSLTEPVPSPLNRKTADRIITGNKRTP